MSLTQHRGKVAALSRSRSADDPDLVAAKRALREARLAEYIKRTIDEAPPFTDDQRNRLALLLSGSGAA